MRTEKTLEMILKNEIELDHELKIVEGKIKSMISYVFGKYDVRKGTKNQLNYFNALRRDEAIAYGKKVAANRGDTESIEGMGNHDIIEVLMPEMVKRNPQKEHGNGDAFMNSLENMINSTDSSVEAEILLRCVGAKILSR